jgi:hypothetical protein
MHTTMRTSCLLLPAALALLALGGCAGGTGLYLGSDGGGGSFRSDNSQLGELHDDWMHGPAGPFPDARSGGPGGGGGGGHG